LGVEHSLSFRHAPLPLEKPLPGDFYGALLKKLHFPHVTPHQRTRFDKPALLPDRNCSNVEPIRISLKPGQITGRKEKKGGQLPTQFQ